MSPETPHQSTDEALGKAALNRIQMIRWTSVAIAIVSVLISVALSFRFTGPRTIYVGDSTRLWRNGNSRERAVPTIQQALKWAIPGDRILVADGTYHERLRLRGSSHLDSEIVVEAIHPGRVYVDSETDLLNAIAGEWRNEQDGIVSAATRWPIYRVCLNEAYLFREVYGGLKKLRELVQRPNAFSAFCWEEDRIFVWLSPHDRQYLDTLKTHLRTAPSREWGEFRSANLMVQNANVTVRGIQFRMGIGCSIRMAGRSHLVAEECHFTGANFGIQCDASGAATGKVVARKCIYDNFPQYDWRKSWLSWEEIYAGHASSSFISSSVPQLAIEDCIAVHTGDGMRISNEVNADSPEVNVHGNIVAFATDDAFEIEGPARNVTLTHNLVLECHESLGLSPVEIGPVRIKRNLFLHDAGGTNGAQVKLINRPGSDRPICNIQIAENAFIGNWLCWMNGTVENTRIERNVFHVEHVAQPAWPSGVVEAGNSYPNLKLDSNFPVPVDAAGSAIGYVLPQLIQSYSLAKEVCGVIPKTAGPSWWNWSSDSTKVLREKLEHLRAL